MPRQATSRPRADGGSHGLATRIDGGGPRLTPAQASAAAFFLRFFVPLPPDDDDFEDPDYGF